MLTKVNEHRKAKEMIVHERKRLINAIQLAKVQWQYASGHQDDALRKLNVKDILERRYMFLLGVAKKRKLHALKG